MTRRVDSALLVLTFLMLLAFAINRAGFAGFALLVSGVALGWYAALHWDDDRHGDRHSG